MPCSQYPLYMQFLKLLSEHFGAIKPGSYDVDVRLAVLENAILQSSSMVVVCGGESYCHSLTWW